MNETVHRTSDEKNGGRSTPSEGKVVKFVGIWWLEEQRRKHES
jgi:hypothetical protein